MLLHSSGSARHAQRVEPLDADEMSVNLTGINNGDPSSCLAEMKDCDVTHRDVFTREEELTK